MKPMGVTLAGTPIQVGPGEYGVRVHEIVNWAGLPDVTTEWQQRPYADGEWVSEAFERGLPLTITGRVRGRDRAETYRMWLRFRGLLPAHSTVPLGSEVDGQVEHRYVRRAGSVSPVWSGPDYIGFSVPVRAEDSRLFAGDGSVEYLLSGATGLPTSTGGIRAPICAPFLIGATVVSGSVAITSGAGAPKTRLRIVGPVSSPVIRDQGGTQMHFDLNLSTGQFLLVDLDRRQVLLNGLAGRRAAMTGSWIKPRDGTEFRFDSNSFNPNARLVVEWTPAR